MSAKRTPNYGEGASQSRPDVFRVVHGDWARLSPDLACRFSFVGGRMDCRWNTSQPPGPDQWPGIEREYLSARNAFLELLARRLGIDVLVIDRRAE
jgi:hypothetical protein